MGYDERGARLGTRAVARLAWLPAVILGIGAAWALLIAVGGALSHQLPIKKAALFAIVALIMLGGAALQIAGGRRAKRIAETWDAEPPAT